MQNVWLKNGVSEKFSELEENMSRMSTSKELVYTIYGNRIQSMLINILAAGLVLHFYIFDLYENKHGMKSQGSAKMNQMILKLSNWVVLFQSIKS